MEKFVVTPLMIKYARGYEEGFRTVERFREYGSYSPEACFNRIAENYRYEIDAMKKRIHPSNEARKAFQEGRLQGAYDSLARINKGRC